MREVLKPCLSEDWLDVNKAAKMVGCSARTLPSSVVRLYESAIPELDEG